MASTLQANTVLHNPCTGLPGPCASSLHPSHPWPGMETTRTRYAGELRNAEPPPQSRPMFRAPPSLASALGRSPMLRSVFLAQARVGLTPGAPDWASPASPPPRNHAPATRATAVPRPTLWTAR